MLRAILSVLVFMVAIGTATAQSDTTFTYQGALSNAGAPINGTADLRFRLFLVEVGGGQLGTTQTVLAVPVTNGVFTIPLDFGVNPFNAFDAQPRWLEVDVRSPAGSGPYVTLAPRQLVSRVPYAIQTRGIYVDDEHNVGIGTVAPQAPLHVREGQAATGLVAQSNSSAVFERDANNYISLLSPTTSERGILFGDTTSIANGGIVFNNPSTPDGLEFRTGGNVTQMFLKSNGRLGLGTSTTLGQLTIADGGATSAVSADSSSNTFPTLFATNTGGGPALWAHGTDDVKLAGGGLIVAGDETGENVGIDGNEIMARNNGQPSTLYLNLSGGDIAMGIGQVHPAYAYGKIRSDGTILSGSSNVVSVNLSGTGFYVEIAGGVNDTDVIVANEASPASPAIPMTTRCSRHNAAFLRIEMYNHIDGWGPRDVSFIVYRP